MLNGIGVLRNTAIIVLAVLGLGLTAPSPARGELVDRIVAVVNDDIILLSDLEEAMKAVSITLEQQGYTRSQISRVLHEQRPIVLGRLVDDKLTDQQVTRHNITIDEEEIDLTIQRLLSANKMTEDDLKRALALANTDYEDYREEIRNRMLRSRLLSREVQSKIVVTDSDIRAYYASHQDLYAGFKKYDLRHIVMRVPPGADQTAREKVYQQIHALHQRLQDGEAFDQLAELYSHASSARQGGRLGVYSVESLTETMRNALKSLKAKQFTKVLDTEQGYQIFYIEEIISSGGKSIEEATPEIQEKLYADIVDRNFRAWLEELRNSSHIQIIQ